MARGACLDKSDMDRLATVCRVADLPAALKALRVVLCKDMVLDDSKKGRSWVCSDFKGPRSDTEGIS